MLPNSDNFICQSDCTGLQPASEQILLNSSPYDISRLNSKEFLLCDSNSAEQTTQILAVNTTGEKNEIMSIPGTYERWDYFNDFVLLVNR